MPGLTIVYWRDIPAQVIVGKGRTAARRELPERFAEAIDRAAMKAGAHGTDDYLTGMRDSEVQAMQPGCVSPVRSADGLVERYRLRSTVYKRHGARGGQDVDGTRKRFVCALFLVHQGEGKRRRIGSRSGIRTVRFGHWCDPGRLVEGADGGIGVVRRRR